jgi:hypothetical protein
MLRTNPIPFVLTFLVGWVIAMCFYAYLYNERITAFQERLHDFPPQAKYGTYTNRDLQQEKTRLVNQLRDFQQKRQTEDSEAMRRFTEHLKGAKSENETQRIQQEQHNEDTQRQMFYDRKFQGEFFADIIALRNEMLKRLPLSSYPQRLRESYVEATLASGILTGPDPIGNIASELEQLANSLPSAPYRWFSLCWQDTMGVSAVFLLLLLMIARQIAKHFKRDPQPAISPPSGSVGSAASTQKRGVQQQPPRPPRPAR